VITTGSTGISAAARNATVTSLIVCCALVLCLSPNKLILIANSLGYPLDWSGWFYHFTNSVSVIIQVPDITILQKPKSTSWSSFYHDVAVISQSNQTGSTTSPWSWCSSTALSTLSSTPPSTASSSKVWDVWCRKWEGNISLKFLQPLEMKQQFSECWNYSWTTCSSRSSC